MVWIEPVNICETDWHSNWLNYRDSSNGLKYRSGTVNSNMLSSKFHLIRSYCEIFFYNFPNIPCLKYTVNSNFHLIRSKTLLTDDFELTVPDLHICVVLSSILINFTNTNKIQILILISLSSWKFILCNNKVIHDKCTNKEVEHLFQVTLT